MLKRQKFLKISEFALFDSKNGTFKPLLVELLFVPTPLTPPCTGKSGSFTYKLDQQYTMHGELNQSSISITGPVNQVDQTPITG